MVLNMYKFKAGDIVRFKKNVNNWCPTDLVDAHMELDEIIHGNYPLSDRYNKEFAKICRVLKTATWNSGNWYVVEWWGTDENMDPKFMRLGFKEEDLILVRKELPSVNINGAEYV